jgi:antitoxin component of MazEF toxin-antitoxin module
MTINIVQIGTSKGIRIPSNVLKDLEISNRVDFEVRDREIILKPIPRKPRAGWAEAAKAAHKPEGLVLPENLDTESKDFTWEW